MVKRGVRLYATRRVIRLQKLEQILQYVQRTIVGLDTLCILSTSLF